MMTKLPSEAKEQGPANLSQLQACLLPQACCQTKSRTHPEFVVFKAQASAMAGVIKKAGRFAESVQLFTSSRTQDFQAGRKVLSKQDVLNLVQAESGK